MDNYLDTQFSNPSDMNTPDDPVARFNDIF